MKRHLFIYIHILTALAALTALAGCRTDDPIVYMEEEAVDVRAGAADAATAGLYVLCEGNMGSNKCTLDYLDLRGGTDGTVHYLRNIYAERNPGEVKELGDVGNDIEVYGQQLWLVVNCSNKVEVCRVGDTRKLAQVDVPNCRSVAFHDGYAYVSSYVGPVGDMGDAPRGQVYKIDTLTHRIAARVTVGYQPEELAVVGDRLYVANSGGYRAPDYDRTLSVVDLRTFTVERHLDCGAPNLQRLRADRHGQLWLTSRGNGADRQPQLLWLRADAEGTMQVGGRMDLNVSDLCIVGDSLYYLDAERRTSGIVNVATHEVVSRSLSAAPEFSAVKMPYGIIVHPTGRDFYVMDAKNYVSSGELLHFLADGTFDYKVRTGDIPAHAVFVSSHVDTTGPADTTPTADNYIAAVDEYVPAPGQFVNTLPEATADDTPQTMAQRCTDLLADNRRGLVTLGGWGGYLTFHFHRPVVNVDGQRDFAVWGNTFAGNSEPGVVMVSQDENRNGRPDDTWYELRGSEYDRSQHGYELTYRYAPMSDVPWSDNQGGSGVLPRNGFHEQEYFPLWLADRGALTFRGVRLPDNATQQNGVYRLASYDYGYADNHPNSDRDGCSLDIGWAVDAEGRSVSLTHIDFVRVCSAVRQVCGAIGETSTEVSGAEDLHP